VEPKTGGDLSVVVYSDASGAYAQHASHRGGPARFVFDETIGSYGIGSL
jgi:hypothetical protein